ncbi:tetratricopeptide repeat protein [Paraliomyxa miuraensis]|uniref:tetratricopeptide repeat protein n=1 Tax=Paraliomyxa miuraensis TaxID=376150 RepID=UPI0022506C9B|nr:tetratricopeptide repeat protein [Paraliomyxa miuraensis]MCX4244192.1 tetratricopeptide repeat protein [Paraliomyxa miuraensis]
MTRHRKWKRASGSRRRSKLDVDDLFADAIDHHRGGRLDAASSAYDEVLRQAPEHAAAWSMKGVLALQQSRPADAVPLLKRAIELDATQPGFHLNLGNALRGVDRLDDAIDSYRHAIALDPDMAPAHNNLGNALRDRGDLPEAADAYRGALEIEPSFFPAAANLAQVLAKRDLPRDEVLAALDRALALAEASGLRTPDVANLHNARGNALQADGRIDDTIACYRQAVALDSTFSEAHLNLGRALARNLQIEDAIDPLRHALELRPDDLPIYKQLALALRRLQRFDEATAVYQAWHERDPSDPIAAHMANVRGDEAPPERATDEYVQREFDDFAEQFDDVLVNKLQYQGPKLIADAIERSALADRRDLDVLDAGCGTGLCAPFLRPRARRLVGIDLSRGMLARARQRGVYDELIEAELTAAVEAKTAAFDLIAAADVFIYFGELDRLVRGFRGALRPGGALVFTAETSDDEERGWALNDGGRYAHHPAYLRRVLEIAGFEVREMVEDRIRFELGTPALGWVLTAFVPELRS